MPLPPGLTPRQIKEISLIPKKYRADAVQEAWVAHLEGKPPVRAAKAYYMRECRHEEREQADGLML